jgi:hypothetical protein
MKNILEEVIEGDEKDAEARKKRRELPKRVGAV